jgi:hypothetical protein
MGPMLNVPVRPDFSNSCFEGISDIEDKSRVVLIVVLLVDWD